MNVFENYAKNIENNYKVLKPLKVQSSLGGVKVPKIQNFFMNGFNGNNKNLKNEEIDNKSFEKFVKESKDLIQKKQSSIEFCQEYIDEIKQKIMVVSK